MLVAVEWQPVPLSRVSGVETLTTLVYPKLYEGTILYLQVCAGVCVCVCVCVHVCVCVCVSCHCHHNSQLVGSCALWHQVQVLPHPLAAGLFVPFSCLIRGLRFLLNGVIVILRLLFFTSIPMYNFAAKMW